MRTLLLTQIVPNPPDAGPKAKTHYVLRTLAALRLVWDLKPVPVTLRRPG